MIATEDEVAARETFLICDLVNEFAEVRRAHTRVATALVDLVRRCFNEQRAGIGFCLSDGSAQHPGMRGTHGINALGSRVLQALRDEVLK